MIYRKTDPDPGVACAGGCLLVAATIFINLLLLAAIVWIVANIVKAVFHL